MSYQYLDLDRTGHVATMTLRRPEKLNAFHRPMALEIHQALDALEGEFPDIRVLILTGEGRGFCSGADVSGQAAGVSQPPALESDEGDAYARFTVSIFALAPHLAKLPQPVIAAVNGVAAGAGLGLALSSDIRLASDQARFSSIFIKRAVVPDNCASYILPALAGMSVASEMAYTGRIYDARWALKKGLVNSVVPAHQLMEETRSLAEEISSNPPLAVRSTKQLMSSHFPDLYQVAWAESNANKENRDSEDRREAALSFIEKRPPVFKGR